MTYDRAVEMLQGSEQDNLNAYYTRSTIGDLLVANLEMAEPRNVLDLGAGEGSLSRAVSARWPLATYTTVDIDPEVSQHLTAKFRERGVSHRHVVWNVLQDNIPAVLSEEKFDLAVCNPPFFKPKATLSQNEALQESGLHKTGRTALEARAEIVFLAQNIRLIRDGGYIALIVPDSLLTGDNFKSFRKAVTNIMSLETVIQLPNHSFHNTEARCFIMIMRKQKSKSKTIKLIRHHKDNQEEPIFITYDQSIDRMDYDFYAVPDVEDGEYFSLSDLCADVRRGSFNSAQKKSDAQSIFHTTDFRNYEDGIVEFSHYQRSYADKAVIVEKGDILIARVDRCLHEKVVMVSNGKFAITDCVYRVRVPEEHRMRTYRALRSEHGRKTLLAATKGVGARLLGKGALLTLKLR